MRLIFAIQAWASVQISAATPPACLLSALGIQENPADVKAMCSQFQQAVMRNLTNACHPTDDLSSAYNVYSSKCLEEGITVGKHSRRHKPALYSSRPLLDPCMEPLLKSCPSPSSSTAHFHGH
ncbi:hypothetical protein GGR57DRAFT_454974 [Xylariaceae sp. FL1272]|nr:hypothetical protein GGR57DRAFT_454974 [Xylariaceae sp. FL1272]